MVKDFEDGDFINEDDLDEIVTSGVMRFADAAARNAALIGDLAPVHGVHVFTESDSMTWTYLVVGGIGYWTPEKGSIVLSASQTSAQSIPSGTSTAIQFNTTVKNVGTWYSTSTYRFNPKVPGFFELAGGVSFDYSNVTGYRMAQLRLNGSGSSNGNMAAPSPALATIVSVRGGAVLELNGTTDYVELCGLQTSGGAISTLVGSGYQVPTFTAKYLGL